MSKLTDHLSKFLPFPREDKRYVKERGEELATSFLIKEALKTGAYLAEELEHQNLNERIRFRASRDHAVILGTMLNRIFDIRKEDLLRLDGWKERSAERFLKSLAASKSAGFGNVLFALGIRYVGETTAKSLARHFRNIDAIISATMEELLATDDIGEVIADSIITYFADPAHLQEIERLKAAGLRFTMDEVSAESSALAGKIIVISGNFSISRDEMKSIIERNGGRNSGSVSGKTSYLLAGSKPGPEKMKKAEQLGIPVISEEDLMHMIRPGSDEVCTVGGSDTGSGDSVERGSVRQEGQLTLF